MEGRAVLQLKSYREANPGAESTRTIPIPVEFPQPGAEELVGAAVLLACCRAQPRSEVTAFLGSMELGWAFEALGKWAPFGLVTFTLEVGGWKVGLTKSFAELEHVASPQIAAEHITRKLIRQLQAIGTMQQKALQ